MQKIVIISLLITMISKMIIKDFPKEVSFDKNNNEFELTFSESGVLFISISFETENTVNLILIFNIDKIGAHTKIVETPGMGCLVPFKKGYTNTIILNYMTSSNAKGKIWMNPSTNEIKVKFDQIYEFKYDFYWYLNFKIKEFEKARLTYSIDKAEKNVILQFKYNQQQITSFGRFAPNPIEICYREQCKTNITIYEIKKGESYKVYINLYTDVGENYAFYSLPFYSFNFIDFEEEINEEIKEKVEEKKEIKAKQNEKNYELDKYIVIIFILGILLSVAIVISIILICRQNNKQALKKNTSGIMMVDLENIEDEDAHN